MPSTKRTSSFVDVFQEMTQEGLLISLFCFYSFSPSPVLLPVARKSISAQHVNSYNATEGQRSKERGGLSEEQGKGAKVFPLWTF